MHRMLWSVGVAMAVLFVHNTHGLQAVNAADGGVGKHVLSPVFSKFIGSQITNNPTTNNNNKQLTPPATPPQQVSVVIATMKSACGNATAFSGKLAVLLDNESDFWLEDVHDAALCCEQRGAVAVLVLLPDVSVPGMTYHMWDTREDRTENQVVIPVLCASQDRFESVVVDLARGEHINIILIVDNNPWEDIWSSSWFFAVWNVFIPMINIVGVFAVVNGLQKHIQRVLDAPGKRCVSTAAGLMQVALTVELLGFVVRIVYCACGPVYSSSYFSRPVHNLLIASSLPVESISEFIAVAVMVHWGVFGTTPLLTHLTLAIGTVGTIALHMCMWQLQTSQDFAAIKTLSLSLKLFLFANAIATGLFLHHGRMFAESMKAAHNRHNAPTYDSRRGLLKAQRWTAAAGTFQAISLLALGTVVVNPHVLLTPAGFNAVFLLLHISLTGNAIVHTIVFVPTRAHHARRAFAERRWSFTEGQMWGTAAAAMAAVSASLPARSNHSTHSTARTLYPNSPGVSTRQSDSPALHTIAVAYVSSNSPQICARLAPTNRNGSDHAPGVPPPPPPPLPSHSTSPPPFQNSSTHIHHPVTRLAQQVALPLSPSSCATNRVIQTHRERPGDNLDNEDDSSPAIRSRSPLMHKFRHRSDLKMKKSLRATVSDDDLDDANDFDALLDSPKTKHSIRFSFPGRFSLSLERQNTFPFRNVSRTEHSSTDL